MTGSATIPAARRRNRRRGILMALPPASSHADNATRSSCKKKGPCMSPPNGMQSAAPQELHQGPAQPAPAALQGRIRPPDLIRRAFSTPFAIPSCRRIGSAISGATERAADSYSDYLTGAAIPLAAPSGKRMYDHPGAVGLTGSPAHYFGAARKWGVNLRSSGVRARRLLLSQAPAWLGRLQAHHLGSARRTSSRRLGVPPAFRGKFPVPGCSCRPPREKRPTAVRPVAALSLTTTKEWRPL